MSLVETTEHAFEILSPGTAGPFLLTCEHASSRVPTPLRSTASDRAWLSTHWGLDIGARTITREIARRTGSEAVLARFSRLVIDTNRPPEHADLVRPRVEGRPLSFNWALDDAEVARRVRDLHGAYHGALDARLARRLETDRDVLIVSIHSFTPVWNQRPREMDVGVLFDLHEPLAHRLAHRIAREGYDIALNEPYSGKKGLIYAADRLGRRHDVPYVEIEVNQSLCCTPARARRVARTLAGALLEL